MVNHMSHTLRARARASWRPLILIFLLVLLAGTTFTFVKLTFADKLERVKSDMKIAKVRKKSTDRFTCTKTAGKLAVVGILFH